jgi:hypothetical protein
MNPVITLKDCVFVAPAGWSVQSHNDHLLLQNMESGCLIVILEPQPSSGDLEQDARAAFELMYRGWDHQKSGEQRLTLSKGRTPQGLEYRRSRRRSRLIIHVPRPFGADGRI